jgi:coatomer protein complex subunit alpha (xenin)
VDGSDAEDGEAGGSDDYYAVPPKGVPTSQRWAQKSKLVADHAAAGAFDSAFDMLQKQAGVVNFEPFKDSFMAAFAQTRTCVPGLAGSPPVTFPINRNWANSGSRNWSPLPAVTVQLATLSGPMLQAAYNEFKKGKFEACANSMRAVLYKIPMLQLDSREDVEDAQALIGLCQQYILGCMIEKERKGAEKGSQRAAELAAYFTHCDLQPEHLNLTLRAAMGAAFKLKNYKDAASFARRMLDLGLAKKEVASKAKKIIQTGDRDPTNATELNYDSLNPFATAGDTFVPIYKGTPSIKCSFCHATYSPDSAGSVCNVCKVAEVGKDGSGLRFNEKM